MKIGLPSTARYLLTFKFWMLALLAIGASGATCSGQIPEESELRAPRREREHPMQFRSGPYCGLYGLYSAMQLDNVDIEIRELLDLKYIGSSHGSSFEEIEAAASDHEYYAISVKRMTTKFLRKTPYRVLLHVKSSPDSLKFDHFVLYNGVSGGKARILDLPDPEFLVSFDSLQRGWDGTGLLLSRTEIQSTVLTRRNPIGNVPIRVAFVIAVFVVVCMPLIRILFPKVTVAE